MIAIKNVQITPQTVNTGQTVTLSVLVFEVDWNTVKQDFTSWQDINTSLASWTNLKNYNGVR